MSVITLYAHERECLAHVAGCGWTVERRNRVGHLVLRHTTGRTTVIPRRMRGEMWRSVIARLRRQGEGR